MTVGAVRYVLDMGKTRVPTDGLAGKLIDELRLQEVELSKSQARRAELMVEFSNARKELDRERIADCKASGFDDRYKAGEFAALEISLAVKASKYLAQRIMAMTRRVQTECPDAWDAWHAGQIDHDKVVRINRALRRLVHDSSKQLLNSLVVDVAIGQTPELLGRWLNQFIARVEPDEQDERLRRSMEDRYASVRPDIDGMSFLSALMSAVDAAAIDRILAALAAAAPPGDTRTMAQRRSDALVDMLCGRISNGCHVRWDTNDDSDDNLDDPADDGDDATPSSSSAGDESNGPGMGDGGIGGPASTGLIEEEPIQDRTDQPGGDGAREPSPDAPDQLGGDEVEGRGRGEDDWPSPDGAMDPGEDWVDGDWDLPASAFRPDPYAQPGDDEVVPEASNNPPNQEASDDVPGERPVETADARPRTASGTWRITPCPGAHQPNPLPVSIGVVVSVQSLFGYSNTPGQLMDRSSLVPADVIRELAQQQGSLFYRLLTDEKGNLLDVTEMGRFPSRRLGMAVKFRSGVCQCLTCHVSATRCDLDHLVPVPEGPTSGINLGPECRGEHRAKTHAGHQASRIGPHTTQWITPTGHVYTSEDPQLPVEEWPPP